MNGKSVKEMNDVLEEGPRDLSYFIEPSSISSKNKGPIIHRYSSGHPEENHVLEQWINDHRILTKVSTCLANLVTISDNISLT